VFLPRCPDAPHGERVVQLAALNGAHPLRHNREPLPANVQREIDRIVEQAA